MILIDIGSFKGEEIIWGLQNGYDVHAFEANPAMKTYLKPYESVAHINYAAAWNTDGVANLYLMGTPERDLDEDGVSMMSDKTNVDPERFIEVPTINIGRYLKELDKTIDILKINTEGAEYVIIESILENFDPTRIKRWMVEDHSNFFYAQEWFDKREQVLERLQELGIKLENWNSELLE